MNLYDYATLLTEIGPGAISDKQKQEIAKSSLREFYFNDDSLPNSKFGEDVKQDFDNGAYIEVTTDSKSFDFNPADSNHFVVIYKEFNEIAFSERTDSGGTNNKTMSGITPENLTQLFKLVKACISYHIIYNDFKKLEYSFVPTKSNQESYKLFWSQNPVPKEQKTNKNLLKEKNPEIYAKYEKLMKVNNRLAPAREKLYLNVIKFLDGTVTRREDTGKNKEERIFFKIDDSKYKEIKEYYESI